MTINTTTSEATQDNGNIYKHVNTQTFNEVSHKSKNEYFINGKQVRNHDSWIDIRQYAPKKHKDYLYHKPI